jgi:predicted nucleic acid-binding protein
MILYLDTSALVKRYLVEDGTQAVKQWIDQAQMVSTSLIARAEMGAAITKAVRMTWITAEQGQYALQWFRSEWESFGRLPVNEATVLRADEIACRHGLRGYDAVHLACALLYRDGLGSPVSVATYDRLLWQAARAEGFAVLPDAAP